MTGKTVRFVSVALAMAAAEVASLAVFSFLDGRADAADAAHPNQFAGLGYAIAAQLLACVLLPLVMWGVLRLLRQRGTVMLICAGSLVWFLVGLRGTAHNPHVGVQVLLVVCFALLGGLLALTGAGRQRDRRPDDERLEALDQPS